MLQLRTKLLFIVLVVAFPKLQYAADQPFVMKKITYGPEIGVFCCEAKIDKGDTATLTIRTKTEHVQPLLASIHSSHPATIASTPANAPTTVTLSFKGTTAATVGVTYLLPIADTHSFRHGIRQSEKPPEWQLSTYVLINDRSGSSAAWENTPLTIRRGSLELAKNISLGAGESIVLPVPELQGCSVTVANVNEFLLAESKVFELKSLTNNTGKLIPEGNIRILSDGKLEFVSNLAEALPANGSIELKSLHRGAIIAVSEVGSSHPWWHELLSLDAATLRYKTRPVIKLKLTNRADKTVTIRSEWPESLDIGPEDAVDVPQPIGPVSEEVHEANLFDLTPGKVQAYLVELQRPHQQYGEDVDEETVNGLIPEFTILNEAQNEIQKLENTKAEFEKRLKELRDLPEHLDAVQLIIRQISKLNSKINEQQKVAQQRTANIAKLLFK